MIRFGLVSGVVKVFPTVLFRWRENRPSREMLVISCGKTGFVCFRHDWAVITQRSAATALIRSCRCDDLHRQASQSRRSPKSSLLLLVDFSLSFFFLGSCMMAYADVLLPTWYMEKILQWTQNWSKIKTKPVCFTAGDHLTVCFPLCLCLRVWMVGMLANLTIGLSYCYYYYQYTERLQVEDAGWPCGWEYKTGLFLFSSFFWPPKKLNTKCSKTVNLRLVAESHCTSAQSRTHRRLFQTSSVQTTWHWSLSLDQQTVLNQCRKLQQKCIQAGPLHAFVSVCDR